MSFTAAKIEAASRELDLILRNKSTEVPVVQMTPYRFSLLKAFYSERMKNKNSKAMEVKIDEKSMSADITHIKVNREIGAEDLEIKIGKIARLVTKKKEHVRITIEVDTSSKVDKVKAKLLLQNIKNKLKSVGDLKETDASEKVVTDKEPDDDKDKRRKAIHRPKDEAGLFMLDVSPKVDMAEFKSFEKEMSSLKKIDEIINQVTRRKP